ncbi:MAG TPA: preprotein translocase subunit SecE [Candidatus Dormibacteraeota bacterium]|nr:preprotein translocase subunit SecE [Candidatus Dormibacteraeota bacterium]
MARAVRGQPSKSRTPVGPPTAGMDRNYFASVVDELRKVVWPTWNELARMTGVVVTTVILMALIVSAADFALGQVVKQLYSSSGTSAAGSQVAPKGSTVSPGATSRPAATAQPTSAGGSPAPITP